MPGRGAGSQPVHVDGDMADTNKFMLQTRGVVKHEMALQPQTQSHSSCAILWHVHVHHVVHVPPVTVSTVCQPGTHLQVTEVEGLLQGGGACAKHPEAI